MDDPSPVPALAEDALLGLLLPFWQLVIGAVVLAVLLLSVRRLARRGPSRMTTALLITAEAMIADIPAKDSAASAAGNGGMGGMGY